MKTIEYMAAVKKHLHIDSDYALAKALAVTKQTVSRYAQGKGYFDDEIAARVATILGINPGIVVLDIHRERAKTPQDVALWNDIFAGFPALSLHAKSVRSLALPR